MTHSERTCIGCRETANKRDLLRIVKTKEGEIRFDPTGKAAGRGAYVCSSKCLEDSIGSNRLASALRASITEGQRGELSAELEKVFGIRGADAEVEQSRWKSA